MELKDYRGQLDEIDSRMLELFARRMKEAGGVVRVGIDDNDGRGRAAYGHHPHGLDVNEQAKLAAFCEGEVK